MPTRPYAAETPESLFAFNSYSFSKLFGGGPSPASAISPSPWFQSFALPVSSLFLTSLSLPDDVLYELSLLLSVLFALFVPYITTAYDLRAFYSTFIGVVTVIVFSAEDVVYFVTMCFGAWLLCRFLNRSRYCGLCVFIFTFSYLGVVRYIDGIGAISLRGPANMCLLLTALRLVSIGFHVQDQVSFGEQSVPSDGPAKKCGENNEDITAGVRRRAIGKGVSQESSGDRWSGCAWLVSGGVPMHNKENVASNEPGTTSNNEEPLGLRLSLLEMAHYIFFFCGLWSGPFISYSSAMHCLRNPSTHTAEVFRPCLKKVLMNIGHSSIFMLVPLFFQRDMLFDKEFMESAGWTGTVVASLILAQRRARFVTAWMTAEVICLLAGLGYDPTVEERTAGAAISLNGKKVNPLAVKCFDNWNVEFYTSLRKLGRNWNCSVQTWLVLYVYKRCSWIKSSLLRKQVVMVVSAYWHGWDIGYYGMFVMFAFFQAAQEPLWNRRWPGQDRWMLGKFYSVVKWFVSFILVQFATVPFVFTNLPEFLHVWRIQHFHGLYVFGVLVLLNIILSIFYSDRQTSGGSSSEISSEISCIPSTAEVTEKQGSHIGLHDACVVTKPLKTVAEAPRSRPTLVVVQGNMGTQAADVGSSEKRGMERIWRGTN
eukprot:GHVS01076359.1.p1 GENE.GHVS01076359.1~~GHVS01076359.1.p1  ORF type:complete len:683 (+),score=26.57 GHVS01076359.1:94-2049(+)